MCMCARLGADVVVQSQRSVVISGHPEATRLGMEVLRNGGNAADALVTVSLALGVAEPGNSGVGGKIVLLYYEAKTKKVSAMVALGAAPLKLDVEKAVALSADAKRRGWKAVCTPGLVAGISAAHEKWGTRPWASLVTPAADLAEKGFALSELAAEMDAEFPIEIDPVAAKVYAPNGKHFHEGDVLKNPDLAATLRMLAEKGPAALYGGEIGQRLVKSAQAGGCSMTMEDLTKYRPRFVAPLSTSYHGYEVFSSPPPLSGGTTMLLAMKCLDEMSGASAAAPARMRPIWTRWDGPFNRCTPRRDAWRGMYPIARSASRSCSSRRVSNNWPTARRTPIRGILMTRRLNRRRILNGPSMTASRRAPRTSSSWTRQEILRARRSRWGITSARR